MNFLNVPNWKIIEVVEEKNHYFVRAAQEQSKPDCPRCRSNKSEDIILYGHQKRQLKDSPIHGKSVIVLLSTQKFFCKKCEYAFVVGSLEANTSARLTHRLTSYIQTNCLKKTSRSSAMKPE